MISVSETLSALKTEQLNERSEHIDTLDALGIVRIMNEQDSEVAGAVRKALPQIAQAVEGIYARMLAGGRLFYVGAGTSGRLGVLDASECPPTFNLPDNRVIGIIAGGDEALRKSSEAMEDDPIAGRGDLQMHNLNKQDAVVAISASGYAPYCTGALEYARECGALTVALSCNQNAPFSALADVAVEMPTGAEVLSGSTRLKAGTATKMALNMISTSTMILLGKAYHNMMVDVRATNAKLRERALRLTACATGLEREQAEKLLEAADGSTKLAIVMHRLKTNREGAQKALEENGGSLRRALKEE